MDANLEVLTGLVAVPAVARTPAYTTVRSRVRSLAMYGASYVVLVRDTSQICV